MHNTHFLFTFLLAALLACSNQTEAQQVSASVSGTVTDKSGSSIVGASVTLTSKSTGAKRETTTAEDGNFRFNAILAGAYTLDVKHVGFKNYQRTSIELLPNETHVTNAIRMGVGDVTESITVAAETATVQIASGERSGIITAKEIENLTVMNRDFATLVALLPGVVDNPGSAEVQGFSGGASYNVAGNRSNGNSITIDGGSTENTNGGNGNNFVSMDSVGAVRIVTSNYQAEFGRKPAASIMAITKSGTQQLHGAAYWYYRHESLNANDFFSNRQRLAISPRRVQTPGFNIGGPLFIPGKFNTKKSKLFFFSSQEFIREKRPQAIRNLTVPTDRERAGDFSQTFVTNGVYPNVRLTPVNDPDDNKRPFPGNIIPQSRINPSGQNYLKLLPRPNGVNQDIAKLSYNYQVAESLDIPKIAHTTKVDYVIDAKTSIWVKYNYWREDQRGWAVSAGNSNWGWLPSHYISRTHAPVVSLTRIISPSTVFEFSARLTRWTEDGSPLNESDLTRLNRKTSGVNIAQFNPAGNPHGLVPNATFGGVSNSPNTSLNSRFPLRGAESPVFSDAILTQTKGRHVMKYGFYYERWRAVKGENGNWNGTLDFSTDTANPGDTNQPFANALLGNFKSYVESNNRPPLYETTTSYEWFAQDNWKVTKRLTLDLGVRFGWSTPFYSSRRQEAGFVPSLWNPKTLIQLLTPVRISNVRKAQNPITGEILPATLIGAITPGLGDPFNGTVNLLTNSTYPHGLRENSGIKTAPRIGFAYDPFGKGKTAIRGGIGLFYEIHEKDLWGYALHLNPPNQLNPQIYYGDINTFTNTQGYLFPSNTSGLDPNRTLGRTISYSFGVQHSLPARLILDVAYVGTLGRHLLERRNINSVALGTTLLPAAQDPSNPGNPLATQYLRPYLGYGDIQLYGYDSNSSYHSMQTTLNRRFNKGLSGGIAWTWSKAMDYTDADTTNLNYLVNPKIWNYGEAGFDRTHILKGNFIYEAPRIRWTPQRLKPLKTAVIDGWKLSGITTQMSGAPTAVTLALQTGNPQNWSGSPTATGVDAPRVLLIANPTIPKSDRTFERNFNTGAFAIPPQGSFGNASKYSFRGPGINNFDISIFKDFRPTERVLTQFRAEAYNIFNHTQFSSLDTTARFDNRPGAAYGNQLSATFGQFTASRLPRRMQLALRITF